MGSFSETLIDPKDLCHGNKNIYPEMTEQFHFNSVYCCEKKKKNNQHPIVLCFPIDGIT